MKRNINLLEGPIFSSLWRFSAPFMLTAFVQMAYNLTDMMWIGRLSAEAVAAVGIVGILTWLGDSVSILARTGTGVLLAQNYGKGDLKKTLSIYNNGYQLSMVVAAIFALLTTLFLRTFITIYGLGEPVSTYAFDYGIIVLPGLFFKMVTYVMSQAYQSLGNSGTPFRIMFIGLVANMILDPFFIFGFGPIPALGIKGAAIATTGAQILVFLLFHMNIKKDDFLRCTNWKVKPNFSLWKDIFKLGLPVSLLSAAHCLVSLFLSILIAQFGATGLAVTSVGSQMESISWMTSEGYAGALTAMVAQNYGARKIDRVKKTIRLGMTSIISIGIFAMLFLFFFRSPLFHIFLPGETEAIALGVSYLAIFAVSQPFMTMETGGTGCFNGLGQTLVPSVLSIALNIARIPASYLLIRYFGIRGIWIAMSGSTVLKGSLNNILLYFYLKKKQVTEEQAA